MTTQKALIEMQREALRTSLWDIWHSHRIVTRFSTAEDVAAFCGCCGADSLPERRALAQEIGKTRGLKFVPVRSEVMDAANHFLRSLNGFEC